MSGAPKRLHEEGSHSTPLKRPIEETSIFYSHGKLIYPAGNDFRLPFESGQDGRLAKVHRIEPRDVDKRVPLLHRMATSPNNYLDHPVTAENKSELRNSKDARHVKTENRETKAEIRELYTDTRIDHQGSKVEKDVKLDTRVNEKEIRSDRVPHCDFKGDVKFDSYTAANSHLNLKETKEHHRGKRYFEPTTDGLDSWRARHGLQSASEVAKNLSTAERDSLETHEAVGENKVDMKGDEKNREKDKKRKDEKYRDTGERDKDRNDRQNNLQVVGSIIEHKEPLREERETENWKRERSDAHKDKEYNDTEKDPTKGEPSDVHEKESLQYEKELVDGPARISEREIITSPLQQHKDDGWRASDTDVKDRGGRMDVDVADKHEKQAEFYDKEPDDGCADGDGVAERNGEVFGYGFQQRRRMLRSRGAPQAPYREPQLRSRAQDNEGSQGQSEVSTVVYKPGVCMQELLKTWREFEASQDCKTGERFPNGPTLEIQIPAEYVTATNRQVRGAQLWGTDIYTNDSDLVAVLMHTGYCRPTASPPPVIHELWATVQVRPPQDCYASTLRNNVRSRAWGAGIGCSFRVERCCIVKKGGGMVDLEPRLTHISAIEPTLAPVSVERTITTRAAASNALRQQRLVREVTVQYNLCNEPWLKYSISIVADKGLKKPLYTSARLKKGGVLYLETHHNRYELCFSGERAGFNGTASTSTQAPETEQAKPQNHNLHIPNGERYLTNRDAIIDVFRWSRCKKPLPQKIMRSIGIPLPVEHLEVLEEHLEWEDVQWSQTGVWVAGKEYVLARVHFLSQT